MGTIVISTVLRRILVKTLCDACYRQKRNRMLRFDCYVRRERRRVGGLTYSINIIVMSSNIIYTYRQLRELLRDIEFVKLRLYSLALIKL